MMQRNDDDNKSVESRRCKVCGKSLAVDAELTAPPFCSERCKLNDLSKWFGEQYRIASSTGPSSTTATEEELDVD